MIGMFWMANKRAAPAPLLSWMMVTPTSTAREDEKDVDLEGRGSSSSIFIIHLHHPSSSSIFSSQQNAMIYKLMMLMDKMSKVLTAMEIAWRQRNLPFQSDRANRG
jgi:hypothetical protein